MRRVTSESIAVPKDGGTITTTNSYAYFITGAKKSESRAETGKPTLTISYIYNNMGQLIQQNDPDGVVKTFGYDRTATVQASRWRKMARSRFILLMNMTE